MSFSSELKSKLLEKFSDNVNTCCVRAETFGEYITTSKLKSALERDYLDFLELNELSECCLRSILIGSFLSSGYINNPNVDYHLEVIFKNKALADYYIKLLSIMDFYPKYAKRNVGKSLNHVIYLKDAEQISRYLSILGASVHLLKFEEIRVEKEVKNNLNRSINCSVANISKTKKASDTQIKAIQKIKEMKKYNKLDDKLKEVCKVRLKYKDKSLEELANILNITKSGLKHRLDKIIKFSESL